MSDIFAACHKRLTGGYGSAPDPDDRMQIRAMPIILHIPKTEKPYRTSLLEAAAVAAVSICFDQRSVQEGIWSSEMESWAQARIRKVARRARGAHWQAVQDIDGITSNVNGAQARALVPGTAETLDPRVNRLQIGGTELDIDTPGDPRSGYPILWINPLLDMTVGKLAAQVGHATMLLAGSMTLDQVKNWAENGFLCSVRTGNIDQWNKLLDTKNVVAVRDAGFTEVTPGSVTVLAEPTRGSGSKN
ncbi:MAG: aminoacyl-tRNA hydrolase [Mycobacteriaceae bacterium]